MRFKKIFFYSKNKGLCTVWSDKPIQIRRYKFQFNLKEQFFIDE